MWRCRTLREGLSQKKGGYTALVAQLSIEEADDDELFYDEAPEAAYVMGTEIALFTI